MAATGPPHSSSKGQGPVASAAITGSGRPSQFSLDPFHPAADTATYRDLLIFEERLKQNAARLVKRKKKYQTFLVLLCAAMSFFSYNVFLDPPDWQPLHYLNVTILLVTATMLFLFFASGMYAERILAANKFLPQSNRSLRNFNMYLNTRQAPRTSLLSLTRLFRSQETSNMANVPRTIPTGGGAIIRQSNGQTQTASTTRRMHIPAIPPSSNPRGELIFSPKVSSHFREGYERYRAAFERRRREKLEERKWKGWRRWWLFLADTQPSDSVGSVEKAELPHARHTTGGVLSPQAGKSSLRSHRTRNRPGSGRVSPTGSETSSLASSRASSPSASPIIEKGSMLQDANRGRRQEEAESTPRRGRDRTPSVTPLSDQHTWSESATLVATKTIAEDAPSHVIAPVPSSVASRTDDRSAPEATLREPESADQVDRMIREETPVSDDSATEASREASVV